MSHNGNHRISLVLEFTAATHAEKFNNKNSVLVCVFIYIYIYIYIKHYFYYDQQMHNYHTPTYFDTIVSSAGSL